MASVYDRSDIYDLFDSPKKDDMTKAHWKAVLSGLPVRTALSAQAPSHCRLRRLAFRSTLRI